MFKTRADKTTKTKYHLYSRAKGHTENKSDSNVDETIDKKDIILHKGERHQLSKQTSTTHFSQTTKYYKDNNDLNFIIRKCNKLIIIIIRKCTERVGGVQILILDLFRLISEKNR